MPISWLGEFSHGLGNSAHRRERDDFHESNERAELPVVVILSRSPNPECSFWGTASDFLRVRHRRAAVHLAKSRLCCEHLFGLIYGCSASEANAKLLVDKTLARITYGCCLQGVERTHHAVHGRAKQVLHLFRNSGRHLEGQTRNHQILELVYEIAAKVADGDGLLC